MISNYYLLIFALISQGTTTTSAIETQSQHHQQEKERYLRSTKNVSSSSNIFSNDINTEHVKKITNGEETAPGRYPYQVALYKSTDEFGCAGTLIAPDWVLTAAHCGGGFSRVEIGRHDRSNSNEVYESIDIAFEVQHPGYILDSTQIIHDVMLLKLRSPSNYTTVKLDDGQVDITTPGTVTTSIGWGKTDYLNHDHNDILLETENWIVDNYECGFYYDELGHVVTDDMICASREEGISYM